MSERTALLRHIVDHPDDDAARLVVADWFDENGEPERAEFVRLQVEPAQADVAGADGVPPEIITTRDCRITRVGEGSRQTDRMRSWLRIPRTARAIDAAKVQRMETLYRAHRDKWLLDVAQWARPEVDFCRGFIGTILTTARKWTAGASSLLRAAPIADVVLHTTEGVLRPALARPEMARVKALTLLLDEVTGGVGDGLADTPGLRGLRSLRLLTQVMFSPTPGMRSILGADWPELTSLKLKVPSVDVDLRPLASNTSLGRLLGLQIECESIWPGSVEALADSPSLGRLGLLKLKRLRGGEDALAIVRSTRLGALHDLSLPNCDVPTATVIRLAEHPGLARLRRLNLTWNPIGDAGVIALAASPHAAGLQKLELPFCQIGDVGALALAGSPFLDGLQTLNLENNTLGPSARGALRERFGQRVLLR